jgi:hypothetical protein
MQDGFALEVRVTPADIDKAFEVMQDIIFVYNSKFTLVVSKFL